MKVVLCGPPHSGKSTFAAALVQTIRERQRRQPFNLSFTYVPLDVTDNSLATLLNPGDDVPQHRDIDWTRERAEERQTMFQARDEQLVLGDAPGQITDELRIVIEPADSMIIISSYENQDKVPRWRDVAEEMEFEIFAELITILNEDVDIGWRNQDKREAVLQSVERESYQDRQIESIDDTTHRLIRQLGTDLLERASKGES